MADISTWNLADIKRDAIVANHECSQRGLMKSAKWAAELSFALDQVPVSNITSLCEESPEFLAEFDRYTLAKSYFDLKEYDRAAYFAQNCNHPKVYFLHVYARYCSGEKKKLDGATDSIGTQDSTDIEYLKELRLELHKKYKNNEMDGYSLYLYGVVLRKLDLIKEAIEILINAAHKAPLMWGTWLELIHLVTDKEMLLSLSLPDHWMKQLFLAHAYLELQLNEEAFHMYQSLVDSGFSHSTYIMAQIALTHHNLRDVDMAVDSFSKLQKVDPYRLENMDIYSNLLYVKEMRAELAHLAHHCCEIDKYRVETCCVIGNYYSLRMQHEKAVLYFQRALNLNPNYLSACTLMGHEYVEIKNTPAAIQAYRQAIEVNRRDYRAWYGLGQMYEILKMPFYSLYYYRQAQMLRPNDSRMVIAMGETYEKLDRLQEAKKCFWKAQSVGDIEGIALMKLAKLFERLNEEDQAAAAYLQYIHETERQGIENPEELCQAYKYLAKYHLEHKNLEEAYHAAHKCTEFNETREEGKSLLKLISRLRATDTNGQHMELGNGINSDPESPSDRASTRLMPTALNFT